MLESNRPARGRAQADAQGRGDDGAGSEDSIALNPLSGVTYLASSDGFVFDFPTHPFLGGVSK